MNNSCLCAVSDYISSNTSTPLIEFLKIIDPNAEDTATVGADSNIDFGESIVFIDVDIFFHN